jgi:hypothetical protein
MLYEKSVWKKYASRDVTKASDWAPMPKPPQVISLVPTAEDQEVLWRYTTRKPGADWFRSDFDASSWAEGQAGFGSRGTPGAVIGTEWRERAIWIRREFTLPERAVTDLRLQIHHDEDVEVYLNGVLAFQASGYTTSYEAVRISAASKATLQPGANIIAIHCRQTTGGQYVDAGLVDVIPAE